MCYNRKQLSVEGYVNMDHKPYYDSDNRSRSAAPAGRPGTSSRSSAQRRGYAANERRGEYRRPDSRAAQTPGRGPANTQRRLANEQRRSAPQQPYRALRRAPSPRRRRKKDPVAVIAPILIVLAVVLLGVHVGSAWLTTTLNRSTYCDNVTINGISVTHYGKEEGAQYVRDQMAQRLSTVYTLTQGDNSWSFSPSDFNASIDTDSLLERAWNLGHVGNIFDCAKSIRSLKENPIAFNAEISFDEAAVDAFVETLYEAVYIAPVDATVLVDMNQPHVTSDSSRGQELDRETAKAQIISLMKTGEGSTELPMIVLDPALSSEEAMNTMEVIVEYKTDVSARGYNSRYNVRKALSYFNGVTVHPGETIDFNAVVGPRVESRGWQSATEYVGNTTQQGWGGGVCQASTTLYGAMLKAGMTIIERHPHSMTVSYVEPSLDAAVTDSNKNLVFRNDTDYAIYIYTEVTKEYACVTVYGQRPQYRYELYSNIISQDNAAVRVGYVEDTEGKHVWYTTDKPVLYKKGLAALSSDGYLIGYDWDTNVEVTSTWLSHDVYASGTDIYWVGVHSPDQNTDSASNDTIAQ